MLYQARRVCDKCGEVRPCLYEPTGPFRGAWHCARCQEQDAEALADLVKATERRLRNESPAS